MANGSDRSWDTPLNVQGGIACIADWDPARGLHQGQQSSKRLHKQAEDKTASDPRQTIISLLAMREPSRQGINGIRQLAGTDNNVGALMKALEQTRELLREHGDKVVSSRLDDLHSRLERHDWTAIESAVSEATGSMGSLKDRLLSGANGDAIRLDDEPHVNAKLDSLVIEVERSARAAASKLGVRLIRSCPVPTLCTRSATP